MPPLKAAVAMVLVALAMNGCSSRRNSNTGEMYDWKPSGGAGGILHIHATWSEPWCGGAEPDPREWPRIGPWSGNMYIRRAPQDSSGRMALNDLRQPIVDTIAMNAEGDGWLKLPAGTYVVLDADRRDRKRYDALLRDHSKPAMYTAAIDAACMQRWLYGPFPVHTITSGDTLHMQLPLQGQCSWFATPCVQYNGPLPP